MAMMAVLCFEKKLANEESEGELDMLYLSVCMCFLWLLLLPNVFVSYVMGYPSEEEDDSDKEKLIKKGGGKDNILIISCLCNIIFFFKHLTLRGSTLLPV